MAVERIRIRRDAAATWTSENPTLGLGEMGLETDTQRMKIGDGATAWITLDYLSLEPPGRIAPFGMATAPGGYLACDGAAVSRTTHAALFAAIGTTWGAGDGSTTFNLPDLEGAFLRGTGTGTINARNKVGPAVGAFQEDQMQGHGHNNETIINASAFGTGKPARGTGGSAATNAAFVTGAVEDGTNGTPRTGTETRPYAAGVLWCIKT